MMRISAHALALAVPLIFSFSSAASGQEGGFLGLGGESRNPSLHIAPAEIELDVPMPVNSTSLALLLAQAGKGGNLSSMKDAALDKYRQHLQSELQAQLRDFFAGEEIPLVEREGLLSLQNRLQVKVVKHFSDLQTKGGYDLERGAVALSGSFHYRLGNFAGDTLREESLDIAKLKVRRKYLVKTPKGGGAAEDTTEEAIKLALSEMVERILDEIEDDLEADELRDLLSG